MKELIVDLGVAIQLFCFAVLLILTPEQQVDNHTLSCYEWLLKIFGYIAPNNLKTT